MVNERPPLRPDSPLNAPETMLTQISKLIARRRRGAERMDGGRAGQVTEREQAVDLGRLVAGIQRRWRWIVWPTLVAMLASTAFVLVASPRYTGVAKVLLEDQESYFTRPDKASGLDP